MGENDFAIGILQWLVGGKFHPLRGPVRHSLFDVINLERDMVDSLSSRFDELGDRAVNLF